MHKAPTNNIQYVKHPLNLSKSKSAFSFPKGQRFQHKKNYSPNKFYDVPSSLRKHGVSIGFAKKTSFQKKDSVQPSRYVIASEFDYQKKSRTHGYSFGAGRDEYYRGKSSANLIGPGAYHVQGSFQNAKKSVYIGRRVQPVKDKHNMSSFSYQITNQCLNKLSNFKNQATTYRMKTQYYPKSPLQPFDNKVPGPGAYENSQNKSICRHNKTNSTFGVGEKLKMKPMYQVGPGSYNIFSEFGKPVK